MDVSKWLKFRGRDSDMTSLPSRAGLGRSRHATTSRIYLCQVRAHVIKSPRTTVSGTSEDCFPFSMVFSWSWSDRRLILVRKERGVINPRSVKHLPRYILGNMIKQT